MLRLLSLVLFLVLWIAGAHILGAQRLPGPAAVFSAVVSEAQSGELAANLAATLARVMIAFVLAMAAGTAIGFLMGRSKPADRLGDPWLVILLNVPALVVIVLAYMWAGLTEAAAISAVALNKLPNTIVTLREGARALDPALDEMAEVFAFPPWRKLRHVMLPQLAPYLAAATRSGISLVWKIVLVVEYIGRPNGVGFEISMAFQLGDMTRMLAYACTFILIMLAAETLLVQPIERRASRWRLGTA